jgi:O-antigen ligase
MLAFVILGAASLTWAEFLPQALREWRVMLLQSFLFYLLLRLAVRDQKDWALIAETMLFTGLLLSLIGLGLYFSNQNVTVAEGGSRRLLSVYGSPNALGLMLGRYLPFAWAYVLLPVGEWRKILAGLALAAMLPALALTQSLGAILLGLPAGLAMVILGWRGRRALPILGGLAAAGAAALIPLSLAIPRIARLWEGDTATAFLRLNLWRSTFNMLADHPVQGLGLDQFLYAYRSRYILPQAWEDPDLSHPHNLILDYWVRLGLLGVLLALLTQYYFWRAAWGAYLKMRGLGLALLLGAAGAMAAFWAHGLVDMAHFNINLSYIFALLLALVVYLESAKGEQGDYN